MDSTVQVAIEAGATSTNPDKAMEAVSLLQALSDEINSLCFAKVI
jgi:hypothetical protein